MLSFFVAGVVFFRGWTAPVAFAPVGHRTAVTEILQDDGGADYRGHAELQEVTGERPNFLLIITDDQRYGTVGDYMPATQSLIFDQGVTFSRSYISTSACCPSRSSIFTGLYSRNHKVFRNTDSLTRNTVVHQLRRAGYYTGIVGKYLNSWDGSPRPEFLFWSVFTFGSATYFRPQVNVQGSLVRRAGYLTDILRDDALTFLSTVERQKRPFLLVFAPFAPHAPALPSEEDRTAFSEPTTYSAPSLGLTKQQGKPHWYAVRAADTPERLESLMRFRRKQLQSNLAVDRAVEKLLSKIDSMGARESTFVLFMSDNGILWGEHGLTGKACAYEEATRVPMAIRYPRAGAVGHQFDHIVGNVDVAPTIYELANTPAPYPMDGVSLVPVLRGGSEPVREDLLLEGRIRSGNRRPYRALHTGTLVYIENEGASAELYDLSVDPYQLDNKIGSADYAAVRLELEGRMKAKYGRSGFSRRARGKG
jgi:arylsulfatase A-like enzyme